MPLPQKPEAMFQLAMSYKQMGADEWAREQLMAFASQHPDHARQSEAQKLLAQLNEVLPPVQVAQSTPPVPAETVQPFSPDSFASLQDGIVSPQQRSVSSFNAKRTIGSPSSSQLSQPVMPKYGSPSTPFSTFQSSTPIECKLDHWC